MQIIWQMFALILLANSLQTSLPKSFLWIGSWMRRFAGHLSRISLGSAQATTKQQLVNGDFQRDHSRDSSVCVEDAIDNLANWIEIYCSCVSISCTYNVVSWIVNSWKSQMATLSERLWSCKETLCSSKRPRKQPKNIAVESDLWCLVNPRVG